MNTSLGRLLLALTALVCALLHNVAAAEPFNSAAEAIQQGDRFSDRGDVDAALAAYTSAVTLEPTNAMAYCNRAAAYGRRGDTQQAIADCESALRLDPRLDKGLSPPGHGHVEHRLCRCGPGGFRSGRATGPPRRRGLGQSRRCGADQGAVRSHDRRLHRGPAAGSPKRLGLLKPRLRPGGGTAGRGSGRSRPDHSPGAAISPTSSGRRLQSEAGLPAGVRRCRRGPAHGRQPRRRLLPTGLGPGGKAAVSAGPRRLQPGPANQFRTGAGL